MRFHGTVSVLTGVLAAGVTFGTLRARADFEVSAAIQIRARSDFFAPLKPDGVWFDFGSLGQCWRPLHVAADWRPYCDGYWEWTDCGWYWVSDEPWAWACYHYGTWEYDPTYGWVWVPGVDWAPAWVDWRTGGGYIGWAPCAPRGANVAPAQFIFVASGHFRDPVRPSTVLVDNRKIYSRSELTGKMKSQERRIDGGQPQRVYFNEGPGAKMVEKATGKKLTIAPMPDVLRRTPAHKPDEKMPAARLPEAPGEKDRPAEPEEGPGPGHKGGPKGPRSES